MNADLLPRTVARCNPSGDCRQRGTCARAVCRKVKGSQVVDGSLCLRAGWCPMFLDVRGLALVRPS